PDQPPGRGAFDLDTREVRLGEQFRERQLPVVDLEPHAVEHPGEVVLGAVLDVGSAHARHPDEVGEESHQLRCRIVHAFKHAGFPIGDAHRPRLPYADVRFPSMALTLMSGPEDAIMSNDQPTASGGSELPEELARWAQPIGVPGRSSSPRGCARTGASSDGPYGPSSCS